MEVCLVPRLLLMVMALELLPEPITLALAGGVCALKVVKEAGSEEEELVLAVLLLHD